MLLSVRLYSLRSRALTAHYLLLETLLLVVDLVGVFRELFDLLFDDHFLLRQLLDAGKQALGLVLRLLPDLADVVDADGVLLEGVIVRHGPADARLLLRV